MIRSQFRYDSSELHTIARRLEQEKSHKRHQLGAHLRLIADAVSEIAKVDEGRSTLEEEEERINRVLWFPAELSVS